MLAIRTLVAISSVMKHPQLVFNLWLATHINPTPNTPSTANRCLLGTAER